MNARKSNMGFTDRVIRLILAAIILALFFANIVTGILGVVFILLAALLMLTSFAGICPFYLFFDINTCKKKSK